MPNRSPLLLLFFLFCLVMFLAAVFYLRRRRLAWFEYFAFGLLALLLPVLGPFLVIALRPGQPRWPSTGSRLGKFS